MISDMSGPHPPPPPPPPPLQQMRELIAEHKPHIDKMNKTGPQLLELSPLEGEPIREKYTATDRLYAKLKADVTQRAATLDEAISKSTQVGGLCVRSPVTPATPPFSLFYVCDAPGLYFSYS